MAFRDDVLAVLAGGLPNLIERPEPAGAVQTTRVEATPPEPTNRDNEPFLQGFGNVTRNQVLIGGAAILGVIGIILVARSL